MIDFDLFLRFFTEMKIIEVKISILVTNSLALLVGTSWVYLLIYFIITVGLFLLILEIGAR